MKGRKAMTPTTTLAQDFLKKARYEADNNLKLAKPRSNEQFSSKFDRFVTWFSANLTGQYTQTTSTN